MRKIYSFLRNTGSGTCYNPGVMPLRILYQITCFFPSATEYSARLLAGAMRYVDEHPEIEIRELPFREYSENPLPKGKWPFTGALVWSDRQDAWVEKMPARGVKVVQFSPDWEGTQGVAVVIMDLPARCRGVVECFASMHRTSVAYIGSNLHERRTQLRRYELFAKLATEAGMNSSRHDIQGPHPDVNRQRLVDVQFELELLAFLRELAKPAAVWCENDHVAQMVCNAAKFLGIGVPEQLAVLGTGDYHVSRVHHPSISTLPSPGETCGYEATRLLHAWLRSDGGQPDDVLLEPPPIIVRQSTAVGDSGYSDLITRAQRMIEEHACGKLTVEALAEFLDVSKRTLEIHYAATCDVKVGEEIRRAKIERAKRMLRETHHSISTISAELGFSEQMKFSRFFKRATGQTPSQFRQRGA